MLPIFYSFRRCPYAMRARLALRVSETAVELREVSLKNKPAEMLAASPKATVPVLVLPDGRVIDESLDIMHWALARHDPAQWLAADSADLIAQNDGMFKHHLDRYKYPNRYGSNTLDHRAAAFAWLEVLEARLQNHRYLCDDSPRLADYALLPFVRQYAQTDRPWFDAQSLPALHHWLGTLVASSLFVAVMQPLVPAL
jgi:glutathione S-transferase